MAEQCWQQLGCGEYPDVETIAEKLVKVVDTIEPEPELVAKYEERYQSVQKIVSGSERVVLDKFIVYSV